MKVSDDFFTAEVSFTVLNDASLGKITKALKSAGPYFQSLVANKVRIRALPRVLFVHDKDHASADSVVGLIDLLGPGGGRQSDEKFPRPAPKPRKPGKPR